VDDVVGAEFLCRHGLAARHSGEIRNDALHLVDVATAAIGFERLGQVVQPVVFLFINVRCPVAKSTR
jgi:hypothetical protein